MKQWSIIMNFMILFSRLLLSQSAVAPSSGDGSVGAPYQISTLNNLYWIADQVNGVASNNFFGKYFIQTQNIDASETSTWFSDGSGGYYGWTPIGTESSQFSGSYDGDGYTISGLYINHNAENFIGFWGYTNGAHMSNLGLINIDVTGYNNTGGLVGNSGSSSIVSNCYTTGMVEGFQYVGGLIGENAHSLVRYSYSTSAVTGVATCAGLVGYNAISTISNCYSTGTVTGNSDNTIAGFVGWSNTATIEYSYSTGDVIYSWTANPTENGFVGYVSGGTFTGNFWDMETSAQSTTGGTPGEYATGKTTAEMKNVATFTDYTDGSNGLTLPVWDFETNPNDDAANSNHWDIDLTGAINDGYPFLHWQNGTDTALPVELVSFTALAVNNKVKLIWQTATEVNNYGFEIERKSFDADASSLGHYEWKKIGFVEGHGNSNSPKQYLFVDESISGGKYSYRLKQIDNDGSFSYSDEIIVETRRGESLPTEYALEQNYPNPFNPVTTIKFGLPKNSHVSLEVFNILGEKVAELVNNEMSAGYHHVNFNASLLPSGMYIYRIKAGEFVNTKKLILMK